MQTKLEWHQISGCQEWEMVEGGITKVHNKFIGGNGCVYYSVCGDGFTDEYMTVSQIWLCKYV